jgi:hypothetical protein
MSHMCPCASAVVDAEALLGGREDVPALAWVLEEGAAAAAAVGAFWP